MLITCSEIFDNEYAVYIPRKGSSTASWAAPGNCVWNSPECITYCYTLAGAAGYRDNPKLKGLFSDFLEIEDTDYSHYIDQIQFLKSEQPYLATMSEVYRLLLDTSEETEWDVIR